MDVPYRSQHRSVAQRLMALRLAGLRRALLRPLPQVALALAVMLGATLWLDNHTPELPGGGTFDLRASAYGVEFLPAG